MTEPQAQEPGAGQQLQLDPKHLLRARKQRIESLTEENDMLVAFNGQVMEQMRELEEELERLRSKETDGAQPQEPSDTPKVDTEPSKAEQRRNGAGGGPSPADIARRRRTQG